MPQLEKVCLNCKKIFVKPFGYGKKRWERRKFCTRKCGRQFPDNRLSHSMLMKNLYWSNPEFARKARLGLQKGHVTRSARIKPCRECGITLIPNLNWSKHLVKDHDFICKGCHNLRKRIHNSTPQGKLQKKRYNTKYNESPKGRQTMKRLQIKHAKTKRRLDWLNSPAGKLSRHLTHHRRERGLPTKIILGRWFSGSNLHHMTPDIAIYIPNSLHRNIAHNIWTGKNMDRINMKSIKLYADFAVDGILQTAHHLAA